MLGTSRKVLVLNADYRALSVCNVYKAFLLLYLNKADDVGESSTITIHTVDRAFKVPSVIRLRRYVNLPYKNVMLSRQHVFKRDGNKCVYCGSGKDLTLDHVLPKSRGGKTSWTNLVTACRICNARKGDALPQEIGLELPYEPYRPSFVMFLREFSGLADESWTPYLI
jgi:5-methylcytosine-specific restriction endonuclease McrA